MGDQPRARLDAARAGAQPAVVQPGQPLCSLEQGRRCHAERGNRRQSRQHQFRRLHLARRSLAAHRARSAPGACRVVLHLDHQCGRARTAGHRSDFTGQPDHPGPSRDAGRVRRFSLQQDALRFRADRGRRDHCATQWPCRPDLDDAQRHHQPARSLQPSPAGHHHDLIKRLLCQQFGLHRRCCAGDPAHHDHLYTARLQRRRAELHQRSGAAPVLESAGLRRQRHQLFKRPGDAQLLDTGRLQWHRHKVYEQSRNAQLLQAKHLPGCDTEFHH